MKHALFTGVSGVWYRQRLEVMYTQRPKCALLYAVNHLLGTCTTCGSGRYTTETRCITQYSVDRVYSMLGCDADLNMKRLLFARARWPTLLTNLEYPLPIVKIGRKAHVPIFYDPTTRTVIDFMPNTQTARRLIRKTNSVLSDAGMSYIVFDGTSETFRSDGLGHIEHSEIQLIRAFRQYVKVGNLP